MAENMLDKVMEDLSDQAERRTEAHDKKQEEERFVTEVLEIVKNRYTDWDMKKSKLKRLYRRIKEGNELG